MPASRFFHHEGHQTSYSDGANEPAIVFALNDGEAFETVFAKDGGGHGTVVICGNGDGIPGHEISKQHGTIVGAGLSA
jgi:hypothetical protein